MTDAAFRPLPPESTLDGMLGVEYLEVGDERAVGRLAVADHVRQPYGIVHGGAYAAVAESLASRATFEAVWGEGMVALGLSNSTSFLRPAFDGAITSEARRLHRGRTTWLWDVDHRDEQGRLCAASRVTIAIRPAPPGSGPGASPSD